MVVRLPMQQILNIVRHAALATLLGVIPYGAKAECLVRSASAIVKDREVGPVTNLIRAKYQGLCKVQYELEVDGVSHYVKAQAQGSESHEILCNEAIERGRKNLLINLGGRFQTEAVTVCSEGKAVAIKINIGDNVLETELGKSAVDSYFNYRGARCRLFTDRRNVNRSLRVYHGVICQTDEPGANWIVVDKW
jgi:hypothetical protein